MFKPVSDNDREQGAPKRRRKRPLKRVAMLPTLLTLGNLCFGFTAIYACGLEMYDFGKEIPPASKFTLRSEFIEAKAPSYLAIGFWLLVGAAICDALDGRVARRTGAASKFGEQLDSLADTVSFGLAPALMMVTLLHREFEGQALLGVLRIGQFSFLIAVVFLACTALRLARFTVETSAEQAAHEGFRGLPSPGAAAGLVTLVFLHEYLMKESPVGWYPQVGRGIGFALPVAALCLALLMVSRVPYRHFVSVLLKRRPLGHVVMILLVVPLLWIFTEFVMTIVAWTFILSGPVTVVMQRLRPTVASSDLETGKHHTPSEESRQRNLHA